MTVIRNIPICTRMGGAVSSEMNLEPKHCPYSLFMPLHCQGLAPRWAHHAGLGARGFRPCAIPDYMKPHSGECLGIGWKWPCTRPRTFYKNFRPMQKYNNKSNNKRVSKTKLETIEEKQELQYEIKEQIAEVEPTTLTVTEALPITNEQPSIHNIEPVSYSNEDQLSSGEQSDHHSQREEMKCPFCSNKICFCHSEDKRADQKSEVYKKIHHIVDDSIQTHQEFPQPNQKGYSYEEENVSLERYDQPEFQERYNETYQEEKLENTKWDPYFHQYPENQNKEKEFYEVPLYPPLKQNNFQNQGSFISDEDDGWSQPVRTPEYISFPQETRKAIQKEFQMRYNCTQNPLPIHTQPISPPPSPRRDYACYCQWESPMPMRTYDIRQPDYDWNENLQELTSHGYDQCCDEDETTTYRPSCRGRRLRHLVDLFESLGDGRAPPPPASTPVDLESSTFVINNNENIMKASPEHPKRHHSHQQRRRKHKHKKRAKIDYMSPEQNLEFEQGFRCPTQRLEWPEYHRCVRCEWVHPRK